jgi:flagellar basal-body rod protein FlgB
MPSNLIENFLLKQGTSATVLRKDLDAQAMRQRAHAQNIANAETPGYRRVAVEFEGQLKEALDGLGGSMVRSDPRHLTSSGGTGGLAAVQAFAKSEKPDPEGQGVNGVSIDMEMAEMAQTQIKYLASLELLKRKYIGLKSAIKGQP